MVGFLHVGNIVLLLPEVFALFIFRIEENDKERKLSPKYIPVQKYMCFSGRIM